MAQFRTRKAPADGVLLIDKPEGFTSHDVVARVRRLLRPAVRRWATPARSTRSPPVCWWCSSGRATKLARFFVDLPKEYECTVRFGVRSDTGDLTGLLAETGERTTRASASRRCCPSSWATWRSRCP